MVKIDKHSLFVDWATTYGGPKDLQRFLDHYTQSGDYPDEFELYFIDFQQFEKTGYWPVRDFESSIGG